jgi:hypothetical protein
MLAHIGDNADHRLLGCRSWQAQKPPEAFNRMKKAVRSICVTPTARRSIAASFQ